MGKIFFLCPFSTTDDKPGGYPWCTNHLIPPATFSVQSLHLLETSLTFPYHPVSYTLPQKFEHVQNFRVAQSIKKFHLLPKLYCISTASLTASFLVLLPGTFFYRLPKMAEGMTRNDPARVG